MAKPKIMGQFTAIGMRTPAKDLPENSLVINTCGQNDTAERGSETSWVWSNPTNRAIIHHYEDITAVSVECLWQGCKILKQNWPDQQPKATTLNGNWREGKAKAPIGAYAGKGQPLITNPGDARRKIYIPAFKNLIEHWLKDPIVAGWVSQARNHKEGVFLRDHDTGRGIDRHGPMSHAWVLCEFLNTGKWPS